MAWPKGTPRPPDAGRKKGTPNKSTREIKLILEEKGFNVAEELIALYQKSKDLIDSYPTAAKCLTELASFVYAKRKAIEHTGELNIRPYENLTEKELEQRIRDLERTSYGKTLSTRTPKLLSS